MRQFELTRKLYHEDITAQVSMLDEGIHILLAGGERSHVGAVALAQNGKLLACPFFPGHKEQAVCEHWALLLSKEIGGCATVACGIHYDHIAPEGIQVVLNLCNELLGEVLQRIERGEPHEE